MELRRGENERKFRHSGLAGVLLALALRTNEVLLASPLSRYRRLDFGLLRLCAAWECCSLFILSEAEGPPPGSLPLAARLREGRSTPIDRFKNHTQVLRPCLIKTCAIPLAAPFVAWDMNCSLNQRFARGSGIFTAPPAKPQKRASSSFNPSTDAHLPCSPPPLPCSSGQTEMNPPRLLNSGPVQTPSKLLDDPADLRI
jgi:hypothetical protein